MKVPKQHSKWPNLYRFGYEDAREGKASTASHFMGAAREAYVAGYESGTVC